MSITEYNLIEYKETKGYPLSKFLAEHKLKVSVHKKATKFVVRLNPRVYYIWIDQICSGVEEISFDDCSIQECFRQLIQSLRNHDSLYYITGKHKVLWWWVNDEYNFRGRRDLVIDEGFYNEFTQNLNKTKRDEIIQNQVENKLYDKIQSSDIGLRVLEL